MPTSRWTSRRSRTRPPPRRRRRSTRPRHATPRFLRIAGEVASARDLAATTGEVKGNRFRLLRAGDLGRLEKIVRFTRRPAPGTDDVYPPWQGMQYMHNMYDGRAKLAPLDNPRYGEMRWTGLSEVLSARSASR